MITTKFLAADEFDQYGEWLKKLDEESKHLYFGRYVTDESIDTLVETFNRESDKHHFLIAEDVDGWLGVVHIAEDNKDEVEYGFTVDPAHRRQGVADILITQAILWSTNRGYRSLYMHCVSWNTAIKRLCVKHGLELETESGESETKMPLPRPNFLTLSREIAYNNRNVYRRIMQTNFNYLRSISSSTQLSPN